MEAWQKDFWQLMEAVANEAEQSFSEVTEVVEEIAIAVDQLMTDAIEPILEAYLGLEVFIEEATQPVVQTVQPILDEYPACIGCRHFHGQVYGGNPLICAMYPYGPDSETCPDWQSTWNHLQ
jgi:hypothetical protein